MTALCLCLFLLSAKVFSFSRLFCPSSDGNGKVNRNGFVWKILFSPKTLGEIPLRAEIKTRSINIEKIENNAQNASVNVQMNIDIHSYLFNWSTFYILTNIFLLIRLEKYRLLSLLEGRPGRWWWWWWRRFPQIHSLYDRQERRFSSNSMSSMGEIHSIPGKFLLSKSFKNPANFLCAAVNISW